MCIDDLKAVRLSAFLFVRFAHSHGVRTVVLTGSGIARLSLTFAFAQMADNTLHYPPLHSGQQGSDNRVYPTPDLGSE